MLVFTTPELTYNGKLLWAYATYALMMLVFTAVTIPYISLPGVITDDPKERLSANGYRLFFAKGAALMVTLFVPLFAARWGVEHIARGYQVSMALMAGLATLLFIFCFFTTTERVKHTIERKPFGLQLELWLKNDQWLILAAVCVVGTIGYVIRGSVALYYAKYFLGGNEQVQASFITTGVAANILAMVASTWITKKFCKIQLFSWTQVAVFISLAKGDQMRLDAVRLEIDGQLVAHYIYSAKELEALRKGGVQRIYVGNVATGDHQLGVLVDAKLKSGEEFSRTERFAFRKEVKPKMVGLTLGGPDSGKAPIELGEW